MILVSNMLSMYSSSSSSGSGDGVLTLTLPKTEYLFGETFSLTGAQVIYTPKRGNPVDVTTEIIASNKISPADNTVWNVSGQQTVIAQYTTPAGVVLYASQVVRVAEEGKGYLTVSTSKPEYLFGDQFNASVLSIIYTDVNGQATPIDPSSAYVTTSPANGDNFDVNGENTITVTYDYVSESGSETASNPAPAYVKVMVRPSVASATLKLSQTGIFLGDELDYTGAKLTVVYSDNSQKVVTFGDNPTEDAKFTWDPYNGTAMEEAGDVTVTATYTENGYSVQASSYVKVSNATLESITFSLDKYTFKHGDAVDYATLHLKATAVYSDSSTRDITEFVEMTPERGNWLVTDTTCTATYTENGVTKRFSRDITVEDDVASLSINLNKTQYYIGQNINYSGALCILTYLSGKEEQVEPGNLTWTPAAGSTLSEDGSIFVVARYNQNIRSNYVQVDVVEEPPEEDEDEYYIDPYTGQSTLIDPTDPDSSSYSGKSISTVTDPETGETKQVVVDADGTKTEQTIPSDIRIVVHMYDKVYEDGDTIDYTGLQLEWVDKDGETFTNTDYPTGQIPYSEYEFPITVAKRDTEDDPSGGAYPFYKHYETQSQTALEEFKRGCAQNGWTIIDSWRTRDSDNVYHYHVYYTVPE